MTPKKKHKKIRYHKLREILRTRHMTLDGLRARLGIFPSEIIKIETEQMISPVTMLLICKFFACDAFDILDYFYEDEEDIFYSRRVLESHSYIPRFPTKKEFKTDVYQ